MIGVGNALVDVTALTLIARMAPHGVLARVFGVLESLGAFALGAGALLAPLMIRLLGVTGALVVVGVIAPAACLLWWRRFVEIDRSVAVRTDDIWLLGRVPMLRPLPVPVLEQLAQGVTRVDVPAGELVFEAGDSGDSFYVVDQGSVRVLDHDQVVRTMGRGEGFGEFALLGRTTRTTTVRGQRRPAVRHQQRRLPPGPHEHDRGTRRRGGHQTVLPGPLPGHRGAGAGPASVAVERVERVEEMVSPVLRAPAL